MTMICVSAALSRGHPHSKRFFRKMLADNGQCEDDCAGFHFPFSRPARRFEYTRISLLAWECVTDISHHWWWKTFSRILRLRYSREISRSPKGSQEIRSFHMLFLTRHHRIMKISSFVVARGRKIPSRREQHFPSNPSSTTTNNFHRAPNPHALVIRRNRKPDVIESHRESRSNHHRALRWCVHCYESRWYWYWIKNSCFSHVHDFRFIWGRMDDDVTSAIECLDRRCCLDIVSMSLNWISKIFLWNRWEE